MVALLIELFKISLYLGLAGLALVAIANIINLAVKLCVRIFVGCVDVLAKIFG